MSTENVVEVEPSQSSTETPSPFLPSKLPDYFEKMKVKFMEAFLQSTKIQNSLSYTSEDVSHQMRWENQVDSSRSGCEACQNQSGSWS